MNVPEHFVSREEQATKQGPVITERDMKRVLQHAARARFPARSRCKLMLSSLARMRVAELAKLKLRDVLGPDETIRAEIQLSPEQTKGRSCLTLIISTQLRSELEAYMNNGPLPPPLTAP
jgi:integrase/recombinase XerD